MFTNWPVTINFSLLLTGNLSASLWCFFSTVNKTHGWSVPAAAREWRQLAGTAGIRYNNPCAPWAPDRLIHTVSSKITILKVGNLHRERDFCKGHQVNNHLWDVEPSQHAEIHTTYHKTAWQRSMQGKAPNPLKYMLLETLYWQYVDAERGNLIFKFRV